MIRISLVLFASVLVLLNSEALATSLNPVDVLASWSSEATPGDAIAGNLPPAASWSLETHDGAPVISTGGNTSGSLISDFDVSGDFAFSGQSMTLAVDQDNTGFHQPPALTR